jgi:hypothetical protein
MTIREEVLSEIEAFLARTSMPPALFGTRAVKDGKFVFRLRSGADLQTQTVHRVRDFIRAQEELLESGANQQ